jgi:drug/metabolite transporter (DMT)-like permease
VVEVGFFIVAFRYLPLADAHAIAGIAPLLVTALAVTFSGKNLVRRRWCPAFRNSVKFGICRDKGMEWRT